MQANIEILIGALTLFAIQLGNLIKSISDNKVIKTELKNIKEAQQSGFERLNDDIDDLNKWRLDHLKENHSLRRR